MARGRRVARRRRHERASTRRPFRSYYHDGAAWIGGSHWSRRSGTTLIDEAGLYNATLSGGYGDGAEIVRGGGGSIDLDGVAGSYATISDLGAFASAHQTMTFTARAWVQLDDYAANLLQIAMGNAVSSIHKGFYLGIDSRSGVSASRKLRGQIFRGQSGVACAMESANGVVTDGRHLLLLTCDGANARLDMDGVQVATAAAIAVATGDASNVMRFGSSGGTGFPSAGLLTAWGYRAAWTSPAESLWLYQQGAL